MDASLHLSAMPVTAWCPSLLAIDPNSSGVLTNPISRYTLLG
jgi:hypothetical protein